MARRDRFLTGSTAEGFAREESRERAAGSRRYGPVVRVAFPAADADRAVAHGLTVVPDGFEHARCTGAVFEVTWDAWTETIAILRAPAANTIAVGRFFAWDVATPEEGV